ncbi:MAG: radical SAM protein [Planctomycetes bacterium]|nr:radical SAM protein [Planctomycetota bacterium]
MGKHIPGSAGIGRLSPDCSISDVIHGEIWRGVTDDFANGRVPAGCTDCMNRERQTGYSKRKYFYRPNWRSGITFLEVNSTNLCPLQCRHCGQHLSHRWARQRGAPVHKPDSALLLKNLRELDLSHLERVAFKGGEPMMNSDVPTVLAHLQDIGRLSEVTVVFTTSGSLIREDVVPWLSAAKRTYFGISIDGIDEVQTYIRHGPSNVARIDDFVRFYSQVPRVAFGMQPSVMIYNVFSLDRMAEWWRGLPGRVPGSVVGGPRFENMVLLPPELSVRCLSDATRARLADRYEQLDPKLYANVVRTLRLPFAGAEIHDQFVHLTRKVDRMFGRPVLESVPELAPELELLGSEADPAAGNGASG